MTATQLSFVLLPIGLFVVVCLCLFFSFKAKKQAPQTHRPHSPGPGYDPAELAISKGKEYADGGVN